MNIYENNLEALAKVDEELYLKLKNIKANETFEVFLAENDTTSNANVVDNRDGTPLHKGKPIEEISKKIKELEEVENYHSLYFFGMGNGFQYESLLQNVRHKRLMIIEPEIELIYIALNLVDFSKEIVSERLKIKLSKTVTRDNISGYISSDSMLYLKSYNLYLYSDFYEKYSEEIARISNIIIEFFQHWLTNKGNSLEDTMDGFIHSTNRMVQMIKSPPISQVIQKIKNRKGGVLVSAGPSLKKQLPLLKKVQDYITILCTDSCFPILSLEGIKPDFVLTNERVYQSAKFYVDTPDEFHKDVIFLLSTVCHEDTFKGIGPGGVTVPFLRKDRHNTIFDLDEWGYLGGGMSCANYLYDLASQVNFENFTFIGQNLSYGKDGSSHCTNHVYGTDFDANKENGSLEAYGGDGKVSTIKVWRWYLNSFNLQIDHANKNSNMKTYNSTEGGARIKNAIEIPFQEFCDKFVDSSAPKEKIVLEFPSQENIDKNMKKYMSKQKEVLKLAKSVSKKAKKSFGEIQLFLEKIKDYDSEEITKKVSIKELDKLNKRLSEIKDKYNTPAFLSIFETLLESYMSHLEFDIAQVSLMKEGTSDKYKLKLTNWMKVHYEWLYRLFATMDKIIEIIENSFIEEKEAI